MIVWKSHTIAWRPFAGPMLVAACAWLWIVCHLDPAGSYPSMPEGPGLTIDETFNVQQGVILVESFRNYGIGVLEPPVFREVFLEHHLPDHPPLGRLWLGVHHHICWWLFPPENPDGPFVTACARSGSATAFALTILLVGCCSARWYGGWAGLMSSLGFLMLPRVIGHAHLAALESMTNLTWGAAALSVGMAWNRTRPPTNRTAAWTGVMFGLALLTKIQAILLPLPIVLWALVCWRQRALRPLFVWGLTGGLVFFAGWPWLWIDPLGHLIQYFGGVGHRATLSVWMWGHQYSDRTVPRIYTLGNWFATAPLKMHFLTGVGWMIGPAAANSDPDLKLFWNRWTPGEFLLGILSVWPLVVFSLPGVPVYDVERLWLPVVTLGMIFFGRGAAHMVRQVAAWYPWLKRPAYGVILLMSLTQMPLLLRIGPVYLSYYSAACGGLAGAKKQKLELNYWGDAVTRSLLEQLTEHAPQESTVAMTPVLHQFQCAELLRQSPILRRHGITLTPLDATQEPRPEYVLLFRRYADLPPEWRDSPAGYTAIAEVKREGVQLAAVYRRVAEPTSNTTE